MFGTLRRLWAIIPPDRRWRWVALVVFGAITGVFELVGAFLIFGLLGMITSPGGRFSLPVFGDVRRFFPGADRAEFLLWMAVVVAVFFVVRGIAYLFQIYIQSRVAYNEGALIANTLLMGYLTMPFSSHLRRNSSELIRNVQATVPDLVVYLFVPMVGIFSESMLVVAISAALLVAAPIVSLIAAGFLVPLVLLLLRVVQPRLARLGAESQTLYEIALKAIQESFRSLRDIKIMRRESFFHDRFAESKFASARVSYTQQVLLSVPRVVVETSLIAFVLAFLGVTVVRGTGAHDTLALLGLTAYAILRVLPSLNRVVAYLNSLKFGTAALDIIGPDIEALSKEQSTEAPETPMPFTSHLRVNDVSFCYQGAHEDALKHISLEIPKGQAIGIVGPTGGGKTTLLDTITGLLPPDAGSIEVDGVSIHGDLAGWQLNLGVVPQTVFLIDDTMRRNIALGVADESIDDRSVWDALEVAQLAEFVRGVPDGLDTVVGEAGVRLSGGQRQRVAIARAMYRKPPVIILDEGTAALDSLTEREFIAAVENLRGDRTVIMVAHRISTVRKCDRIVMISGGQVVTQGSFDELLTNSAEFRQLAT